MFSGCDISAAAKRELEYHRTRTLWWEGEQEQVIAAARMSPAKMVEHQTTGGKRISLAMDADIEKRLTECANKIASHRAAADRFKIEAGAYGTQPGHSYELDADDVVYFRLAEDC
jgi:hypothetical protein